MLVLDVICVTGLALPGITIYRRWPDFIFLYAGASLLALLGLARLIVKGPTDDT